ncbi:MAG: hypothetical protein ACK515_14055 [bacterium]
MLEAFALALTIEVGATHYAIQPDGIWRQKNTAPYTIRRNPPTISVGVQAGRWNIGYTHLGRIESDALAAVSDNFYPKGRCVAYCEPQYLGRYRGSGYVHGIHARREWGSDWIIEAGLFAYKPKWQVQVNDWWPADAGGTPDMRQDFIVRADNEWAVTPTLGFGYRIGKLAAIVRVYGMVDNGGAYNSLYQGQTVTATASYRF